MSWCPFVGGELHVLIACVAFRDNKCIFCGYVESLRHCLDAWRVMWNPCRALPGKAVRKLIKAIRVVCSCWGEITLSDTKASPGTHTLTHLQRNSQFKLTTLHLMVNCGKQCGKLLETLDEIFNKRKMHSAPECLNPFFSPFVERCPHGKAHLYVKVWSEQL